MSSVQSQDDLTAKASIRDAALRLFAEHGPDAVSVRQIAAEADVSPALVIHHFATKSGLREAVNAYAADALDALFDVVEEMELNNIPAEIDGSSITDAFARSFPPDSPLPAYLRRLVLAGDPVGVDLFERWFVATKMLMDLMTAAGVAAPSDDPDVRAAFLLANDLGLILLRDQLTAALGFDPFHPAGLSRWVKEMSAVYRDGIWAEGVIDRGNDENQ